MPDLINKFERYYFEDTKFELLMPERISEILLICTDYDAFMLEEDGRIEEQVFREYGALNLRFPPHFHRVTSIKEAKKLLAEKDFDLIITMHSHGFWDAFKINSELKSLYPQKPIVVLAPFSRDVLDKYETLEHGGSDFVFSWLGNSDILLAIIKLIEDKLNVEHDVKIVGVQTIILVENSIRYYSSYLPELYKTIMSQTHSVMSEYMNEHQKNLRMRGRPKILLATNYEEAIDLYERYKHNLLGIITDVEFERNKIHDHDAGIKLSEHVRKEDNRLPILMQSSNENNRSRAKKLNAGFINKQSNILLNELVDFVQVRFGFGDFIFRDPVDLEPVATASNLRELQKCLKDIPAESLAHHANNDHFSKWLRARTLFPLANIFRSKKINDFRSTDDIREYLINIIKYYRRSSSRGIIAHFNKDRFDEVSGFSRLGHGQLGGKARGLAFSDYILKKHRMNFKYDKIVLSIPQTVVLATDVFKEFMDINKLYDIAYSSEDDKFILDTFIRARFPESVMPDLRILMERMVRPLAIRSSSLLEDSTYQPFAGIYSTYMIPNNDSNFKVRLTELCDAIKCVFASTFFTNSKKYLKATKNVIDEEKMAVIIQEISGRTYGNIHYPTFSGVARSINNYPTGYEKADRPIVNIAAGLGKTIVDGKTSLRFSPDFPKNVIQTSSTESTLKNTQKKFYALDLQEDSFRPNTDDSMNLLEQDIYEGVKNESFESIVSTLDYENNVIRDNFHYQGPKFMTFANILKRQTFPLSEILIDILSLLERTMNNPVEIEFAVNIDPFNNINYFDLLQARPIVSGFESLDIDVEKSDDKSSIIKSNNALGNGSIENIFDIIYVKPESFDHSKTLKIMDTIKVLNAKMIKHKKKYILIGPGRWGTSDPWLGMPVKWADISQASVIVEAGLKDFIIEQSQGSHFFHNITTFGIIYYTVNPFKNDGYYDVEFLGKQKALFEDEFVKHIRFKKPVIVKTDGRSGNGVILKPV
ncbi:MAG: phosphoenolpyruvate synthase [Candidatus Delongbacteria bacterium]|nr:phosphoenolpyruvate synthase [Candidatus Delongbacteria bacterium]